MTFAKKNQESLVQGSTLIFRQPDQSQIFGNKERFVTRRSFSEIKSLLELFF